MGLHGPILTFRMSYIRKAFEYEQTLDPLGTQGWVGSAGTLHTFIVLPAELPNTGLHVSTLVTSEQELPDTLTWEEKGTACPPGAWREASAPRLHSSCPEGLRLFPSPLERPWAWRWSLIREPERSPARSPAQHSTGDRLFYPLVLIFLAAITKLFGRTSQVKNIQVNEAQPPCLPWLLCAGASICMRPTKVYTTSGFLLKRLSLEIAILAMANDLHEIQTWTLPIFVLVTPWSYEL